MNKPEKTENQSDTKPIEDQPLAQLNQSTKKKTGENDSGKSFESDTDTDESTGTAFHINGPADNQSED